MTDDSPPPDLTAAIEAIWVRHRSLMFERLASIEAAVASASRDDLDDEMRERAHRDAHKLAGALGTFALHDGSAHARSLELAFAGHMPIDSFAAENAARGLRAALESKP